jgi:large subunit ribosomal protein L4
VDVRVIEPRLKEEIFGVKVREHLLHDAIVMRRNNQRGGTASTKARGEVRGGGKKPWRQKGTGRARAGSIRSPIWVGGGTIFGPRPRDYSYQMPKSARRQALLSALSLKRRSGKIIVVEKLELGEIKTKAMIDVLRGLEVDDALIVIAGPDRKIERSARNLPQVNVLSSAGLSFYDVLAREHLIITADALRLLEERLTA